MQEITPERLEVEKQALLWSAAPTSDAKRDLAPTLFLHMIAVMRNDLRQDLAKDQISKAIRALWRDDQVSASEHIKMASLGVAHKPVDITWDDLADAARKLERRHPMDDPLDEL